MNIQLKHAILFTVALLTIATACKKENVNTNATNTVIAHGSSAPDIRDSLIGNYNCIEHYSYTTITYDSPSYTPIWGRADSVVGPVIVTVTKSSDSTSLVVAGFTFQLVSHDSLNANYFKYGIMNQDNANFHKSNDSIFFTNTVSYGISHWDYNYYTGNKQ
jgi:hypothetical protein